MHQYQNKVKPRTEGRFVLVSHNCNSTIYNSKYYVLRCKMGTNHSACFQFFHSRNPYYGVYEQLYTKLTPFLFRKFVTTNGVHRLRHYFMPQHAFHRKLLMWSAAGEHDGRVSSSSARLHLIFFYFSIFLCFFDLLILTKTHKN